jgi:hypothetical protein
MSAAALASGCLIASGRSICETDGGSNVSSGGGNAAVPKGAGGVLAAGDGDGVLHAGIGSDTPSGSGGLNARVLDGDLFTGGALGAVYCSTCGLGKGVLANIDGFLGEGGRQPRRWPHASGQPGRLYRRPQRGQARRQRGGTCRLGQRWPQGYGRRRHPPGCAMQQATWRGPRRPTGLQELLPGRLLLSLSESGWGPPISGWGQSEQEKLWS